MRYAKVTLTDVPGAAALSFPGGTLRWVEQGVLGSATGLVCSWELGREDPKVGRSSIEVQGQGLSWCTNLDRAEVLRVLFNIGRLFLISQFITQARLSHTYRDFSSLPGSILLGENMTADVHLAANILASLLEDGGVAALMHL